MRALLIFLLWIPQPAFEVASIKPTPPARQNQLKFEKCTGGGRFVTNGTPVMWVVEFAYSITDKRVFGAPAWLSSFSDAYDIEAKADGPVSEQQCKIMAQSLLTERFGLAAHRETKDLPAYALTIAAKGPKVREVAQDDKGGGVRINNAVQQSLSEQDAPRGWSMQRLADYLSNFAGRPVVDKTGMRGSWSFSLEFARSSQEEDVRPSLFTAVQDQLGLRLEPARTNVEVLVIDHVEKPSAN